MNQIHDLESQLISWRPRRPSPARKKQLFGEKAESVCWSALLSHWSVPVTACVILLAATVTHRDTGLFSESSHANAITLALSNQSYAAFWSRSGELEQNTLRNTFEWTNHSGYTPSIRSF